ncbi:MAG: RNase H-like domain-containing protein, partial [Cyanobacteria bacterium J06621_15]
LQNTEKVDWNFTHRAVVQTLRNLYKNNFKIVFLFNYMMRSNDARSHVKVMNLLDDIIFKLDIPIQALISTSNFRLTPDKYLIKKLEYLNFNNKLSIESSFYIGRFKKSAEITGLDYASGSAYFDIQIKKRVSLKLNNRREKRKSREEEIEFLEKRKITEIKPRISEEQEEERIEENEEIQHVNLEEDAISTLSVRHNVNLIPQQATWIECKLNKKYENHSLAMTIPEKSRVTGLVIESAIYKINDGKICIKVYNCRNGNLELKRGACITDAEIFLEDFEETPETYVCHINRDRNKSKKIDPKRIYQLKLQLNKTNYPEHTDKLIGLLNKFDNIIALEGDKLGITDKIEHHISVPMNAKPIFIPQYRIPHSQIEEIENEVQKMLDEGIVEPSNTPWSFPLLCIPKKDGGFRIVVDFRQLNAITATDPYPMPSMQDLLNSIGRNKFFSTIDLLQGFLQVPLNKESKLKTGFTTSSGHYVYNRMPFGLKSSPVTFVRLISEVFKGLLGKIVYAYIDDLIVIGNSIEEHLHNLSLVLERLEEANLKIKISKCNFLKNTCTFLGHELSECGVRVTEDKVEAIQKFKQPKNLKNLRSFLGLSGFYRRYIKDYARIAAPLTDLLKKDVKFEWKNEQESAFRKLKSALTTAPVLAFPDFSKQFYLVTDASKRGIGSALMQKTDDNKFKVIAYHSRKLNKAEQNYNITEQECLAVIDSLKHFRFIIFGYKITVMSDHSAIKDIFKNPNHSGRRARWFLTTMDYDIEFSFIPGKQNVVADCLSRYETDNEQIHAVQEETNISIDHDMIKTHQDLDENLREVRNKVLAGNSEQDVLHSYHIKDLRIIDGILVNIPDDSKILRIVIPKSLVHKILTICHEKYGHPGRDETLRQVKAKYIWKGMHKDVKEHIENCHKCAQCRGNIKKAPINLYPVPNAPFDKVTVDLLKLNTSVRGNNYILACNDILTRFVELYPQKTKTAKETAENIYRFINRYGSPSSIMSDNGLEFNNKILEELLEYYGVKKINIMPYHPASNGVAERTNRKIMDVLKLTMPENDNNWDNYLENVQYLLNTRIHESIETSPYIALYGFQPRQPFDVNLNKYKTKIENNPIEARINNAKMIHERLQSALKVSGLAMQRKQHQNASKIEFQVDDLVYIKKNVFGHAYKIEPAYKGPYKVLKKVHGNKYLVEDCNNQEKITVHKDKMKLFKRKDENKILEISQEIENGSEEVLPDLNKVNENERSSQQMINRKSNRLSMIPRINYNEDYE